MAKELIHPASLQAVIKELSEGLEQEMFEEFQRMTVSIAEKVQRDACRKLKQDLRAVVKHVTGTDKIEVTFKLEPYDG